MMAREAGPWASSKTTGNTRLGAAKSLPRAKYTSIWYSPKSEGIRPSMVRETSVEAPAVSAEGEEEEEEEEVVEGEP